MPTIQPTRAKQVSSLGESPAEARQKMQESSGADATIPEPEGQEVDGELSPLQIAEIRAQEEGFSGTAVSGGVVEDAPDAIEPPTPDKAVEFIQQLSQAKLQLQTELDAALALIERYRAEYGELD